MRDDWRLYHKKADFAGIAEQFGIALPLAVILCNRGIMTARDIQKFLFGSMKDLYDPFLMKGMKEGTALLADVCQKGGRIMIIGDYDADGVCASFILETVLRHVGADVLVYIPNRMDDGYGFSVKMAEDASRAGVS